MFSGAPLWLSTGLFPTCDHNPPTLETDGRHASARAVRTRRTVLGLGVTRDAADASATQSAVLPWPVVCPLAVLPYVRL